MSNMMNGTEDLSNKKVMYVLDMLGKKVSGVLKAGFWLDGGLAIYLEVTEDTVLKKKGEIVILTKELTGGRPIWPAWM